MAFIFSVVLLMCGLLWPSLLCSYGTLATGRIRSIDMTVYNANWHHYPLGLRKSIVLIIAQSQKPIEFNGFNLVQCNLEIFGKVLRYFVHFDMLLRIECFKQISFHPQIFRSACSYYLIFRSFSHH